MHATLRLVPAIQQEEWDQFVHEHPQGHLLQSWGWGELKANFGWSPLRLVLRDDQQRIVAAAQILRRTIARVPLRLGHLAYIPKGPVIDWSQPALCKEFFAQLHTLLRNQGALVVRLEPDIVMDTILYDSPDGNNSYNECREHLLDEHFSPTQAIQPARTILLDLAPTESMLLAQMKEKWRYNVRLASRKGVIIRVAQTLDDVLAWYELLQTTGERDQFGIHTRNYYCDAWRIFASRQQLRLLLAEHDGRLLAGIFVGLFANQGIYLYGASSNESRNLMPNYLLQWEAIRWARQQGTIRYDFWGIPETDDEDEAMAGVYRFKSGWGGRVVTFVGCYEHIYRPLEMQLARKFVHF
ncbi:MAG TPA: peptidoglycan bridge formation glycyltransferase FemA/FemB family protein [Ktedonobacteraceae bacterium]|nr:peptidoglycan bridge formation glycyltransferase FemA/FemB family protein [Ktedonobacteraceae bacterium]